MAYYTWEKILIPRAEMANVAIVKLGTSYKIDEKVLAKKQVEIEKICRQFVEMK